MTSTKDIHIHYQDEAIVVVDKPGGLLAVPGRGPDKLDCVVSRIRANIHGLIPQPAVHRLDMYTSGLMVLGITCESHRNLSKQFEARTVIKEYEALLEGHVSGSCGEIRLRFRLDPGNRPLQVYDPQNGKMGITHWELLSTTADNSRILFKPVTGRTHQLRLHAAHPLGLGCPIIGDSLYGSGKDGDPMFLHATRLIFTHPSSGSLLNFFSPPPF